MRKGVLISSFSLVLVFALSFNSSFAQVASPLVGNPLNQVMLTPGMTHPQFTDYADGVATMTFSQGKLNIRGTPYLADEFLFGVLTLFDSVVIQGQKYRYNIYADEMQFVIQDDTGSIYQPMKVNSLEIGDQKFIYDLRMTGKDKVEAGYFEVLVEDDVSLLLQRNARLEVDKYVSNYMGGGGTGDLYYKHSRYYYLKMDEYSARRIRSKREVIKLLAAHKKELKRFIKVEHIRFKRQNELIRLIEYYNSL